MIAVRMDEDLNGAATEVQVVMGKESEHFVRLFGGKMVIRSGGKASGFANWGDVDSYDTDGVSLFHVHGQITMDTRAVQVDEKASSLNSCDCFILLTPEALYSWRGKGAYGNEFEAAKTITETLKFKRNLEIVMEGSEPRAFWDALGGKTEYSSAKAAHDNARSPQLFHCSDKTGKFKMEQIFNVDQVELEEDDA